METTIYLVRHGETVDNARRIMQGHLQGDLTDKGREQARQVAVRLAPEPIDVVVASDLRRAIQTAEVIAEPHGLPVVTTLLLRERDWGSFTGRYIPDLQGLEWPDDIESEERLLLRARAFLIYLLTHYAGRTIVAVGHGIIDKAILAIYADCTLREVRLLLNAEVRVLTISDERAQTLATAAIRTAAPEGTSQVASAE